MKKGQIVMYYPGDKDIAIADKNGEKSFPAIITQTFDDSDRVHLAVFSWNGMSPALNIEPVPEAMDMNESHDHPYFGINPNADVSDLGPQIMESIQKTQTQLEDHAKEYADANQKIGEAMNENVVELTKLFNTLMDRIVHLEKADAVSDQAIGDLDKRIKSIEKKK